MSENSEETEPVAFEESEDNTQVADAGVPGQIMYPEREVDAERAGEFAAGKVDTLEPEDEADEADEEAAAEADEEDAEE
jgi:hypothetical protein